MRHEDLTGGVMRHAEPRHVVDLAAEAVFDEAAPIPARLVNLSRHGFRLILLGRFEAGTQFRLQVPGWPRLAAQVVWNDGGRIGCLFVTPPTPAAFDGMCSTALGYDRDSF